MRNEDIIKHLMNIKDGCLSSCEKAAVAGAIDIVSDYDKESHALPLVRTANDMEVGTWD